MRGERDELLMWEDAYWDAIVRHRQAPNVIDPTLAETIRVTHGMDDATAPRPDFVATLKQELLASMALVSPGPELKPISANGYMRPVRLPIPTPGRRRSLEAPLIYAIAAALLVAIIGGIIGALLTDRLLSDDRPQPPAILAPGTPEPTDETLFEITIPADIVPQGTWRVSGLSHDAYRAHSESVWEPYCCDGAVVQYQLTGAIQVQGDVPLQILRANGDLEDVPANVEATVNKGDTLITLNQTGLTTINNGAQSADVLTWLLLDSPGDVFGGRSGQDGLVGIAFTTVGDVTNTMIPLPGAATVRLWRLIMEPERVVPARAGMVMLPVQGDPSTEVIEVEDDGSFSARNTTGQRTTTVYVISFESAGEGGSTPAP